MFNAHQMMTLAIPKIILGELPDEVDVFVADIDIPMAVYKAFDMDMPPFGGQQLIKI